jgi:hypothetical protein
MALGGCMLSGAGVLDRGARVVHGRCRVCRHGHRTGGLGRMGGRQSGVVNGWHHWRAYPERSGASHMASATDSVRYFESLSRATA